MSKHVVTAMYIFSINSIIDQRQYTPLNQHKSYFSKLAPLPHWWGKGANLQAFDLQPPKSSKNASLHILLAVVGHF